MYLNKSRFVDSYTLYIHICIYLYHFMYFMDLPVHLTLETTAPHHSTTLPPDFVYV